MGDPFLRTLYDQESERKRPEVHGIVVVLHHFGVALLEQTLQTKEADGMQAHGVFSFPVLFFAGMIIHFQLRKSSGDFAQIFEYMKGITIIFSQISSKILFL